MNHSAAHSRWSGWRRAALWLLAVLLFYLVFAWKIEREMADFHVFYRAGKRVLHGEMLYQAADGHYQFKYPPFFALLFSPLALLPLKGAKLLWYFAMLAGAAFLFEQSRRLAGEGRRALVIFLALIVLAKFYGHEINLGQANIALNAALLGMIVALRRGREHTAGGLLALAAAVKPYAVIFAPYLLLRKRWRALGAAALAGLLMLVVPALVYGWSGNVELLRQWRISLGQSSGVLLDSSDNTSLIAFFLKWLGRERMVLAVALAVITALALFAAVCLRRSRGSAEERFIGDAAVLLIMIPLVSPLGWDYTFLSATLGVMVAIHRFPRLSPPWRALLALDLGLIGLTLYDVLGRELYLRFMHWSVITICFVALALFLLFPPPLRRPAP